MSVYVPANAARFEQRPPTRVVRRRISFGLGTLLLAFTLLALIVGNVNVVERRRQLLTQCQENDVFPIWHWEDSTGYPHAGIKDFRELTIYQLFDGWQERATDPAVSFIRDAPHDRRDLSWLRRWLGDRRVSNLFLTHPAAFASYRAAFTEAMIVLDPSAKQEISRWEHATGSLRSQLTRSP